MKNYIFLLLIGFLLVSCSADEEKAEDAFERAQEQLESGNLLEAKRSFSEALKLDSTESRYWNGLGSIYIQLNDHKNAIETYTEAIKLHPDISTFWFNRAFSRKAVGDFEGACADAIVAQRLALYFDISEYCD